MCVGGCVGVCTCTLSGIQLSATPWNGAHQAPLSMEFSRQEYRSGLPFPPSGDLLEPDIKSVSSASAGRFFITEPLMRIYCVAQGTLFNALS